MLSRIEGTGRWWGEELAGRSVGAPDQEPRGVTQGGECQEEQNGAGFPSHPPRVAGGDWKRGRRMPQAGTNCRGA